MAGQPLTGAVRAQINAPAEALWNIVADPKRHPELAGSGEPRETWLVGEGPIRVGSTFESRQNVLGVKYTSRSEVVACEAPRLLRWTTAGQIDWEFRFEPTDAGTMVTHSVQWRVGAPAPVQLLVRPVLKRRRDQHVRGMVKTIRNLARLAGAPEPTDIQVSQEAPATAPPA